MDDAAAEKDIKVLVTGFGPFQDIRTNPSYEIASRLPSSLITTDGVTNVSLIVPPTHLPVTYSAVSNLVPPTLKKHQPDIVLHIGLDTGRDYYALEASAPRDGYHQIPDNERRVFTKAEGKGRWGKLGEKLTTTIDREDVLRRVHAELVRNSGSGKSAPGARKDHRKDARKGAARSHKESPEDRIRPSDDVGSFICGFVYYTSLAWYASLNGVGGERPVVFLHVPSCREEEQLEEGARIVTALARALAESEAERRDRQG